MSLLIHPHRTCKDLSAIQGDGLRLIAPDGRQIIDACGPAGTAACIGHGNERVAAAIAAQSRRIAYAHTGFFTSEPAEALAEILLKDEPGNLARAVFVSSGSEALEAAIKLARQYFLETGQPQRRHYIARRLSSHGTSLGSLAVSGAVAERRDYEPLLSDAFSHVSPCYSYRFMQDGESVERYVSRLAAELEKEFIRRGPDTVAAFCAEPIVGTIGGCIAPLPGYFQAVREICDRFGALLILDETVCGLGRTGAAHAWQLDAVAPDIQIIGPSLAGGYQAIGGILVSARIVAALAAGSGAFVHGHTFQGHSVACAAALEVQRIIAEQELIDNVVRMGGWLETCLRECFGAAENVGDIRGRGLLFALELVQDRAEKIPFDPGRRVHQLVRDTAFACGLRIHTGSGIVDGRRGDHLVLAPPFNVQRRDIEEIVERLRRAIGIALH